MPYCACWEVSEFQGCDSTLGEEDEWIESENCVLRVASKGNYALERECEAGDI